MMCLARWSVLCLLLIATEARSQQISQYTQYVFNHFSVNPGVAGSKDCLDVRLGFRKQWIGFPGAPTTGWASLHGTLKNKKKDYIRNKHGLGCFIEADETGAIGYSHFYLAYAYHIQMAKDFYMSLGTFAGVKQQKLDVGTINALDPTDPLLTNDGSVMVYPEIWPGIWLYSKSGWAGLSIPQALGNRIKDVGEDSRLTRHFLLSGGRRLKINKKMALVPSTLVKVSPSSPVAFDLNAMLEYKRKLGLGVSYRNQDAVAFMVKIPFLKYFTFGYSYDINTSRLRVANTNTHEVILAIYPCGGEDPNKAIVRCPVFE
jgi:type IX secretion system PorP/SprF family membrane protein